MLSVRSGPYDTGARFGLVVPAQVSCGIARPLALVSPNPSTPVAPLQVEGFYAPSPHLSSPSSRANPLRACLSPWVRTVLIILRLFDAVFDNTMVEKQELRQTENA